MTFVKALAGLLALSLLTLAPGEVAAKSRKRASVLSGVVLSMQDEPLGEVAVKLRSAADDGTGATATTDESGEFSVKLSAGEYVMQLSREGFVPFEQQISIPEGQQQTVRVQMLDASMGRRNEAIRAYNAGVTAYEAGDPASAIAHLWESAAADSTLAEPLELLATFLYAQGSFAESADAAERYLTLVPEDRKMQTRAYRAHMKAGNQPRVDEWRTRLARNGDSRQLSIDAYNEGARAVGRGEIDVAVGRFQAALDLNPEMVEAHAGLASVHYDQNRYEEALAAVERALALNPGHAAALRLRFLIHDAAGDREAADVAIDAYAAVEPTSVVELLFPRAQVDFRAERYRQAEATLLKLLVIEPNHAEAHFTLGLIYAANDKVRAREHLERFVALAPEHPDVSRANLLLANL